MFRKAYKKISDQYKNCTFWDFKSTAAAMRIIFEVILSQLQLSFRDSIAKKFNYTEIPVALKLGHPVTRYCSHDDISRIYAILHQGPAWNAEVYVTIRKSTNASMFCAMRLTSEHIMYF